jgi:hypothetical protein
MGSGHSSARTVSESSNTDRAVKQEVSAMDKRTVNEDDSPYNSERKDISSSNRRNSNSKSRYVS